MQLKVTATLWNKVITEGYNSALVTVDDSGDTVKIVENSTGNILAAYPKANTTVEEVE